MTPLERRAERAGVLVYWRDAAGKARRVAPPTLRAILEALGDPVSTAPPLLTAPVRGPIDLSALGSTPRAFRLELEDGRSFSARTREQGGRIWLPAVHHPGYHRLRIGARELTLAVAPRRCYTLADAGLRRAWGVAVQLYGLRAPGDGGLAHYSALAAFARSAAASGASALAISPVHATFSARPGQRSPYSPSSRRFYNALHGAPGVAAGSLARRLEQEPLLDWEQAGRLRLALLRKAFQRERHAAAFRDFLARAGASLEAHACFEVLHARLGTSWTRWPAALREARPAALARFARDHHDEVCFHAFLQWRAAQGLAGAHSGARASGMTLGLIADLAVGSDPSGSDAWSRPREVLRGLSIGAPPDALGPQGQDWGLAALSPSGMRAAGYATFIETLRAAFAHAGGVRIDHAMSLMRLWLVPAGLAATAGAYLRYPFVDLMRLLALESWRHRAVVIGEDLGTVPAGFRRALARAGILGLRTLESEREGRRFRAPRAWDALACATTATHDMPTITGWWRGRDLDWRERLGLFGAGTRPAVERTQRARDRQALAAAFVRARIGAGSVAQRAAEFVGRTASALALLPVEDVLGLVEQPNLPGTIDEHPNWRRRYPGYAATVLERRTARTTLARVARARR